MKTASILLTALLVAASTHGQGTVNMADKVGSVLDARVIYLTRPAVGGAATLDARFVARLWLLSDPSGPTVSGTVGNPIAFGSFSTAAGY